MCKWGTTKPVKVTVQSELNCNNKKEKKIKYVDACLADIVQALENAGIEMRGCCCGHDKGDGIIDLQDGRKLIIKENNGEIL